MPYACLATAARTVHRTADIRELCSVSINVVDIAHYTAVGSCGVGVRRVLERYAVRDEGQRRDGVCDEAPRRGGVRDDAQRRGGVRDEAERLALLLLDPALRFDHAY